MADVASHRSSRLSEAGSRLTERATERARALGQMRGGLLIAISLVVGASLLVGMAFVLLALMQHPATGRVAILFVATGMIVNLVVLFLAWIMLEALGRIERETDRVQQFMDNMYRRMA